MTPNDDLMDFVSAVSGDAFLKVEENLGEGYVRLKVSEAERRQAKHDIRSFEDVVVELLRNSRDAHAQRIFIATSKEADERTLLIIDDGVGIPAEMQERVFEPRVTSKLETMVMDTWGVHGRGMALYSIKSNVDTAVIVTSAPHKGTALAIAADTRRLAERADQSTWPSIDKDEMGATRVARGPHNIVRRAAEFAVEHPGIDIYIGSPAEILSTLVMISRFEVAEADLLFCEEPQRLPVWQRPGTAADASELADISDSVGLHVSERTVHRILSGEVVPLTPVMRRLVGSQSAPESASPDIYKDRRGLKIHHSDLTQFRAELERAFDKLAERYYVHLKCEPKITVGKDEIRVRFDVEKED